MCMYVLLFSLILYLLMIVKIQYFTQNWIFFKLVNGKCKHCTKTCHLPVTMVFIYSAKPNVRIILEFLNKL